MIIFDTNYLNLVPHPAQNFPPLSRAEHFGQDATQDVVELHFPPQVPQNRPLLAAPHSVH